MNNLLSIDLEIMSIPMVETYQTETDQQVSPSSASLDGNKNLF